MNSMTSMKSLSSDYFIDFKEYYEFSERFLELIERFAPAGKFDVVHVTYKGRDAHGIILEDSAYIEMDDCGSLLDVPAKKVLVLSKIGVADF